MPQGYQKSRTLRRVHVRVPSGVSRLSYRRRKPSKILCNNCNQELHGVVSKIVKRLENTPKSHKVPSRPFAGNLCSHCSREKIKEMIHQK